MTIHACCVIILPRKPWQFARVTWPNSECRLEMLHMGKQTWHKPLFMETFIVAVWGSGWREMTSPSEECPCKYYPTITSLLIHACTPSEDHSRPKKSSLLKLCMLIYIRHLCLCCLLFESIVNGYQNFL
ncbi:hypothetical protein VPH35_117046 [Triticum aestivum]|uniref:Uncharacterized protein n=1 Tax=Aegilops tauschii subsp. strangulata TaxID=200361 RepID=A0A453NYJ8_AEGTS